MPTYGNFNSKAQAVVSQARQIAMDMRHRYIGTEHLLLALIEKARGDVPSLPEQINARAVRELVQQLYEADDDVRPAVEFTPNLKKLLANALIYIKRQQLNEITTPVLWLMLLDEQKNVAVRMLTVYGGDIEQMKNDARDALRQEKSGDGEAESALGKYARDLTLAAAEDRLDPVIGREKEIRRVIQILSRRTKNNPVLIGEPGVGKSAVAEGLAQLILAGAMPENLKGKKLMALDIAGIVAGTRYRGDFEERMQQMLRELRERDDVILFIDEIQTIVGAGQAEGSMDVAGILKPALARGELQCIGATTLDGYRKNIEKDAALSRRFQQVLVEEPTVEESIGILHGLKARYESYHRVVISDECIEAAVRLSARYINDRFLPDKAVDLMDEAAAGKRIDEMSLPDDIIKEELRLQETVQEKQSAVHLQAYERAADLRDEERSIRHNIDDMKESWQKEKEENRVVITAEDIARIVSDWTGVPVYQMTTEESQRLIRLEETLHRRVIGQEEAVSAVSRAIRRARAGLHDPKRPLGSFLFLGPTGVGKTELCRALGEAMFGNEDAVIRLDMSEYMEKHAASRMVGSPPGYVGYEEGGQLTEAVRRKPYSVVLFDEIEKAHPDVFNMLLQIMEDGRLTDNTGKVTSFRNCIIVLTSNLGAQAITEERPMGFGEKAHTALDYEKMKSRVMEETRRAFKPEFINRLDEIIVFHALDNDDIMAIAALMLRRLDERLQASGMRLSYTDDVTAMLAREGTDARYGARPLRRTIQKLVEDALSEELLRGSLKKGDCITASVREGKIVFTTSVSV